MISPVLKKFNYSTKLTPREKIPSLDGWRAIAISLVLASHMWASEGAQLHEQIWKFLSNQGNLGVRIFFTLSGFLITYLLIDEKVRTHRISLADFYKRRLLRIFPVYYLYIIVLAVSQFLEIYYDAWSTWFGAFTFTRNVIGQGDSATGHLWSLAVEEQFYLVWPSIFVFLELNRRKPVAFILLGTAIVAAIAARSFVCHGSGALCRYVLHPNSAIRYADCLAIGCVGAFIYTYWQISQRVCHIIAPLFALLLTASTLVPPMFGLLGTSIALDLQSWLAVFAMISSANAGVGYWFAFLNWRPVVFVGLISYSLYIWHVIFLRTYVGPLFPLGPFGNWSIWWIVATLVATVSYYSFEKPILKLGNRWRR